AGVLPAAELLDAPLERDRARGLTLLAAVHALAALLEALVLDVRRDVLALRLTVLRLLGAVRFYAALERLLGGLLPVLLAAALVDALMIRLLGFRPALPGAGTLFFSHGAAGDGERDQRYDQYSTK